MDKKEMKIQIEIIKRQRRALMKRDQKLQMEQTLLEIKYMREE